MISQNFCLPLFDNHTRVAQRKSVGLRSEGSEVQVLPRVPIRCACSSGKERRALGPKVGGSSPSTRPNILPRPKGPAYKQDCLLVGHSFHTRKGWVQIPGFATDSNQVYAALYLLRIRLERFQRGFIRRLGRFESCIRYSKCGKM